jgi:hypothetical protein
MNPRQSIVSAIQVIIGIAAGIALLMPETVMAAGAAQGGLFYVLACRAQNRRRARMHLFLMLAALGVVLFLVALSSMVVIWAGDGQGIEVTFRCTIALCFLVAVLLVLKLLLSAMFEELNKFLGRLARS